MSQPPVRKLAVLLHADVVGSTMLVQKNETLAHERIQHTFQQFSKTIKDYRGITRELRGDALVAEFDRASDAVAAALPCAISFVVARRKPTNWQRNQLACTQIGTPPIGP